MKLSRLAPRSVFPVFLGIVLASPLTAGGLQNCEIYEYNNPFLCTTALEFGAFSSTLRDAVRSGSGAPAATSTLATRGLSFAQSPDIQPWSGMAVVSGQITRGNFTGDTASLILGADRGVSSNLSVGALVYTGNGSITPPSGTQVKRTEVLAGPYFNAVLGNGDGLSGYLLYGQPDYTVANVPSAGESLTGSLTWSRVIARDGVDLGPFASVSWKREWPTATDQIDAAILTVGSSLDGDVVQTANGVRQFFGRVEMDVGNYSDTFGDNISYVAPRIAAGVRFGFQNGGALQLLANASAASDKTAILAAQINYRFEF